MKDFRKTWALACERAGVAGMVAHDFRRTAVRNLERVGVPRSAAMAMVGHRSESNYRRYVIAEGTSFDALSRWGKGRGRGIIKWGMGCEPRPPVLHRIETLDEQYLIRLHVRLRA